MSFVYGPMDAFFGLPGWATGFCLVEDRFSGPLIVETTHSFQRNQAVEFQGDRPVIQKATISGNLRRQPLGLIVLVATFARCDHRMNLAGLECGVHQTTTN